MQVGEQHHVLPQQAEFLWLGFLHLHHQMGAPGLVPVDHLSAGRGVGVIADARPCSGTALDAHLQSVAGEIPDGIGRESHPLLVGFDLLRHADAGHRGGQNGGCHGRGALNGTVPSMWLSGQQSAAASRCQMPVGSLSAAVQPVAA